MSSSADTPLKRFGAFWLTIALFLGFGIATLFLVPLFGQDEVTEADKVDAERRLAIKAQVEEAQAQGLALVKGETTAQVPPSEIFGKVAKSLVSTKPVAVKEERHRDPDAVAQAATETTPEN